MGLACPKRLRCAVSMAWLAAFLGSSSVFDIALLPNAAFADHYVECTDLSRNWTDKSCWHDGDRPDHTGGSDVIIGQNPVAIEGSDRISKNFQISITNDAVDSYYGVTVMPVNTLIIGENEKILGDSLQPALGGLKVTGNKAGLSAQTIFLGKNGGAGTLYIEDGAKVDARSIYTGGYFEDSQATGGGTGTIEVSGAGSYLKAFELGLGVNALDGQTFALSDDASADFTILTVHSKGALYPNGFASKPAVTVDNSTLAVDALNILPDPSPNIHDVFQVNSGGTLVAQTISLTANTNLNYNNTTLWFYSGTLHMIDRGSGSSPSTTVNGQLVFGNQSTLLFDATALDGSADLKINGNLVNPSDEGKFDPLTYTNINIAVNPNKDGFTPDLDTKYTIIESSGGFEIDTSSYDHDDSSYGLKVDSGYHFLDASAEFDDTKGYLTLTKNTSAVADKAATANEQAVGGATEELGSGHEVHDAFISTPSSQSVRAAYNGLTGEVHASTTSNAINAALVSAGVISDRMRGAQLGGVTSAVTAFHGEGAPQSGSLGAPQLWLRGYGSVLSVEESGSAAETDTATGGIMAGFDTLFNEAARIGVALGYSRTFSNTSDRFSKSRIDGFHGFAYGSSHFGATSIRGGLGATYNQIEASRETGLSGLPGILSADYTGWTGQAWLEAAHLFPAGHSSYLEPFAGLSLVSSYTESFTESGNAAALNVEATRQSNLYSTFGIRLGTDIDISEAHTLGISGSLGWRHAFGDVTPESTMSYASGSSSFNIAGLPLERDTLVFDAGIDMPVSDSSLFDLRYSGQLGANAQEHSFKGTFRLTF